LPSSEGQGHGALDLYSGDADPSPLRTVIGDVEDVNVPLVRLVLFYASPSVSVEGVEVPLWLTTDPATHRMTLWVAVGMLIEHAPVDNSNALALLRGHAYSHGLTLDDVAD
jgi:hypothetical protein